MKKTIARYGIAGWYYEVVFDDRGATLLPNMYRVHNADGKQVWATSAFERGAKRKAKRYARKLAKM